LTCSLENSIGPGEVANRVLLEAGTASGREPSATVELRSYLGQYLEEKKQSLGADDEGPFSHRLLHSRRTFVEKLFAIHSKVGLRQARQATSWQLRAALLRTISIVGATRSRHMLRSDKYAAIKADYDQISRAHFPRSYFFPEGMSFARSDALFPPPELEAVIGPRTRGPNADCFATARIPRGPSVTSAILRDTRVGLTLSSGNRFRNTAKVKALLLLRDRGDIYSPYVRLRRVR
jgi:hypothetical protein